MQNIRKSEEGNSDVLPWKSAIFTQIATPVGKMWMSAIPMKNKLIIWIQNESFFLSSFFSFLMLVIREKQNWYFVFLSWKLLNHLYQRRHLKFVMVILKVLIIFFMMKGNMRWQAYSFMRFLWAFLDLISTASRPSDEKNKTKQKQTKIKQKQTK